MSDKTEQPSRILRIDDREGRLLICTDLHGNLADFRRMRALFLAGRKTHGTCHLLFSGDLVHGPNYMRAQWPEYLGSYYEDASGRLVDEYLELAENYAGYVHCLLGNHEHSHVGGPHTPKFWLDETTHFEQTVGPTRAALYAEAFRRFHLVAATRCGVAVTHAAPNVELADANELDQLSYEGYEQMSLEEIQHSPLLGRLIWSRHCPVATARAFMRVLSADIEPRMRVVIFGHDIVAEGYQAYGSEQLLLSTSFGVEDENKYYVELDLSRTYRSTIDLQLGRDLRQLYG